MKEMIKKSIATLLPLVGAIGLYLLYLGVIFKLWPGLVQLRGLQGLAVALVFGGGIVPFFLIPFVVGMDKLGDLLIGGKREAR